MSKPRAVVCGAIFGQVYMEAFRRVENPFELAGIVARGSDRARACAEHYGVPLYVWPNQLPEDVRVACVVVRSGILGGRGSELTQEFLRRGIHVLQEHPAYPEEMAESLRLAHRQKLVFRSNPFYSHLPPVRRFIKMAQRLSAMGRPLFIDATCGCQLLFSLLDIINAALGCLRPTVIDSVSAGPRYPYAVINMSFDGVPASLRVHNQLDPADPDGFSHLLHKVTFVFAQGSVSLVDTHGPVVWIPRPEFPRKVRHNDAEPHFAGRESEIAGACLVGPASPPTTSEVFRTMWPAGVARALQTLQAAIEGGDQAASGAQSQLQVAQVWKDLLLRIGSPELVHGSKYRAMTPPLFGEIMRAIEQGEEGRA